VSLKVVLAYWTLALHCILAGGVRAIPQWTVVEKQSR